MKINIELTTEDFYKMLYTKASYDLDGRLNKQQKQDFRNELKDVIDNVIAKKGFKSHMKEFLLEHYEETDLEDFNPRFYKLVDKYTGE